MLFSSGKCVCARKIGGSLFAAFPAASPPVVWKFDLEKNHSFTLALQGEDEDWQLGVSSSRGEFSPVARFRTREDADAAFRKTQRALLKRNYTVWGVIGALSTVLLVLLFAVWLYLRFLYQDTLNPVADTPPPPFVHTEVPGKMKEGVPLSADQVLVPPP